MYFITICTDQKERLLGEVVEGEMHLNRHGEIVNLCWHELRFHYRTIDLDEFIIMPNHVHGIIKIADRVGAIHEPPLPKTAHERRKMLLPKIVGRFKMNSAKRINTVRGIAGVPLWQRGYHDHIVRDGAGLDRIRQYILKNPSNWKNDEHFPQNQHVDAIHKR
jgi:REP element-mobilizing transposase RayT